MVEGTVVPVGFGESSTYQTSSTMSIIGRHTREPHLGHWKHYKGGSGGQLWLLARERAAPFVRVCRVYNIASPVLHENAGKIYFIADPVDDMPGNVYAFDAKSYIADRGRNGRAGVVPHTLLRAQSEHLQRKQPAGLPVRGGHILPRLVQNWRLPRPHETVP